MKIDFLSAFNLIRRDKLLRLVEDIAPKLYPFLHQCYSESSNLIYGELIILSQRGIQQGDPLGPALFCLMVNALVKSLESEFNVWYLDDASIGDIPEIVLKDFKNILKISSELG